MQHRTHAICICTCITTVASLNLCIISESRILNKCVALHLLNSISYKSESNIWWVTTLQHLIRRGGALHLLNESCKLHQPTLTKSPRASLLMTSISTESGWISKLTWQQIIMKRNTIPYKNDLLKQAGWSTPFKM